MSVVKLRAVRRNRFLTLLLQLKEIGPLRRLWQLMERVPPFVAACFSRDGLGSAHGRRLIRGKFRRGVINLSPALARRLQRYYGLKGGCDSCGASCNLLFRCPHWDTKTHLCTVYHDRPMICRTFPVTPADLRDREIAARRLQGAGCGFTFLGKRQRRRRRQAGQRL